MKRTAIICVLVPMVSCSTTTSDPNASATLIALGKDFAYARSLPEGTRPRPPEDVDIHALIGMKLSAIRRAIGRPNKLDRQFPPECGEWRCVSFTYGQYEHSVGRVERQPNGLMTIIVSTGGPWLLLLGLSGDRVVSAQWRGQR